MTLDRALELFHSEPSVSAANSLLKIANLYWWDGMIDQATYAQYLREVADWLVAN